MSNELLKQAKERLSYDPETGIFTWIKPLRKDYLSKRAGYINTNGYEVIRLGNKAVKAHRLAWAFVHGYFPDMMVDHKDRNKSNNKIDNLRLATRANNAHNAKKSINNKSGYKGVCWHKGHKCWVSKITVDKRVIYLGYFKSLTDAAEAYRQAATKYHGIFANYE